MNTHVCETFCRIHSELVEGENVGSTHHQIHWERQIVFQGNYPTYTVTPSTLPAHTHGTEVSPFLHTFINICYCPIFFLLKNDVLFLFIYFLI